MFGKWVENARESGMDEAEIDAAISAEQRLKVAAIVADSVLTAPSETAVLAVFSEICAAATLGTTAYPQQRETLH